MQVGSQARAEVKGERESQAGSMPTAEPILGLDVTVLRSRPELKWSRPSHPGATGQTFRECLNEKERP